MFFILSKLLFFLLNPANWIIAGILCWFIFRKWKRRKQLGWLTVILFFVFGNHYLFNAIALPWQPPVSNALPKQRYEVGVLLGGMTASTKTMQRYFNGNTDRFIQAARLYHTGHISKIIITGGDGSIRQDQPKEAFFVKEQLTSLSIPDSVIFVEPSSRNTYENAVNTKHLIDSMRIHSPVLLITSATHMRRALACFKKQNIPTEAFACDFEVLENPISIESLLVPDVMVLLGWRSLLKEMVGLVVYKWTGKA